MQYINIDGKILPAAEGLLPADNTAFRYGWGLIETMHLSAGHIALWQLHMQRLFGGMAQLGFNVPPHFTADTLLQQVLRTVTRNQSMHKCRVRIQVFGGPGGIAGPTNKAPHYIIECYALAPEVGTLNENGLVLGIAEGLAKSGDSLANLKTANALIYTMAARQANEHKWNDAIVANTNGHLLETSICNLFWLCGTQWHTPPLADGCVAGVYRQHLMQQLGNVAEVSLSSAQLADADEVIVTNAVRGIRWVGTIGERTYGCTQGAQLAAAMARGLLW